MYNCIIHELLNVFEDSTQRERTIDNSTVEIVPLTAMPARVPVCQFCRAQSIKFKDENFAESKSTAKTVKITSFEKLYIYCMAC